MKEPMNSYEQIVLDVSDEGERLLEDRLIQRGDVQRVIHHAEATGKKLVHRGTGRALAFYRPKSVTYWVEYSRNGEVFRVFTAYSHRMVLKSSGSTKEWVKSGAGSDWHCDQCRTPLEVQTVRLQYMQSIFPINLPACSGCGFILIDEELAIGKVAEAEQALEDK
ncbi:DNA-binding protein [Geoanaerobacter pelophilus]|uniref:DNA-binding protein n=1 Tax=Geoanaerobacter pelophilus TaxID=60036 RepID=A0ABQ0MHZ2_9BACT|nr:CLJU_RS11820 family redox protein [Geoanaerobacter pelophilus]GAW66694.1 DNA-binding protein [Geoanaerobacter pelophilus]